MGLKETLRADLTTAMKARDTVTASTIRMIMTAISNEEVAGKAARVLNENEMITVLTREMKRRREAAEAFEAAGRSDKAAEEKAEGDVIARYLPAQMSEAEIKALIAQTIAKVGASTPADMGKVMGAIKGEVAGKADGALVSSLVKEALAGGQS